jgi:hypothetical protein
MIIHFLEYSKNKYLRERKAGNFFPQRPKNIPPLSLTSLTPMDREGSSIARSHASAIKYPSKEQAVVIVEGMLVGGGQGIGGIK